MFRFPELEKVFLGLDRIYDLPVSIKDYPRYNIGKSENGYKLEMALPGWKPDQFELTLQDGVLKISGEKQEIDDNLTWVHRGISGKSFEKTFKVDGSLKITKATFEDGMLNVDMEFVPETSAIKIPVEVKKDLN